VSRLATILCCVVVGALATPAAGDVWADARESVVTVSIWVGAAAEDPTASSNDRMTGCFISPDGYILTSKGFLEDTLRIDVHLADGRDVPAELVAVDADEDLALVRIGFVNVPCLRIGGSGDLPGRLVPCLTDEPLAPAEAELIEPEAGARIVLHVDLPPEARGAPVLDERGAIVGVVTREEETSPGTARAIPVRRAMDLLQDAGVVVQLSLSDPDALRPRPAVVAREAGHDGEPPFLCFVTMVLLLIVIWLASAIVVLGRRMRRRTVQPIFGRARSTRRPPPAPEPPDDDEDVEIELR
jgi:hypothetical protein